MFQQLLEFTDETAVGSAPSGAGSGKAHVSVCHLQGGQGRKGWEANGEEGDLEHVHGQKSHIRSGGSACCEFWQPFVNWLGAWHMLGAESRAGNSALL